MLSSLTVANGDSGNAAIGENRVEDYSYQPGGEVVEMGGQKFSGERKTLYQPNSTRVPL
jgi:hypothetical protein